MIIRLGYAVISKTLEAQKLFRTITFTNYQKENNNLKLEEIIRYNLEGLREVLKYNVRNNIHFYRLNSSLIPLATHKEVTYNYQDLIQNDLKEIGQYIKQNRIRIDTHPDQYCVLNSTKKEVVLNAINMLEYEAYILNALNLKNPIIILHIGSKENSKEEGLQRFIKNFFNLKPNIQKMIALENDDKVYNIKDTLNLCQKLNIPMVLDYHHHVCNNDGLQIEDFIEDIFNTWHEKKPKIHFSSPKSYLKKEFRSHHDYIDVQEFIKFLNFLKKYNKDLDIMIEAKMKDEALFRLIRELKYLTNYEFIDETSFKI